MKNRKTCLFLVIGALLMLSLIGCGKQKYKLNFDGPGFESKKTEYAAGNTVTVRYDMIATDTDYRFSIDDDVEMKQDFDGGYVFTFTMPAHDVTLHVSSYNSMVYVPQNEIWSYKEEQPVSMRYDRMWEYSAFFETEDPGLISNITYMLACIQVGEPTDMAVEDYTDILTFTFADGSTTRVEFEENIWVTENGNRYEVSGLENLRRILGEQIGEE